MELTYLKELYRNGLFEVYDGFDTWQDAVSAACTPLIQQGLVEPAYADSIVENVAENGPYIFIAPHICMPHSKRTDLVHQAAVSFVKINRPVCYDENDSEMGAELFFAIAVKELNAHLDVMMDLADVFDDEQTVQALLDAKTKEDFDKLLG